LVRTEVLRGIFEVFRRKAAEHRHSIKSPEIFPEIDKEPNHEQTGFFQEGWRNSSLVIQSIHTHEGHKYFEVPAEFMQPFAHACFDVGADVFFNTGAHLLRGIEIYKGKPIFYCLGNFFFQYETVKQIAAATYEAVGLDRTTRDPMKFYDVYARIFKAKTYWESFVPFITY
jgi:poly-gamma-glutamate synthesis protein (capsule biosynthesis protein)